MEKLRAYWKSRTNAQKRQFAAAAGTTPGYIRKLLCLANTGRRVNIGADLAIGFERASGGAVRCEDVQPATDWSLIRGKKSRSDRVAA
jgi:DNA-binding transcriptional regulator YdaS (Cro superfamily)